MSDAIVFGKHSLTFERSKRIIVLRQVGELTLEDAQVMIDKNNGWLPAGEPQFMLSDMTEAAGIGPKARAFMGEASKTMNRESYVAVFGGSFQQRVIANLMFTAIRLLGQNLVGHFEADEAKARAWLEARVDEVEKRGQASAAAGS